MATKLYYKTSAGTVGPTTIHQLVEAVKAGEVQRTDLVRKESDEKWSQASQVKGLFPEVISVVSLEPEVIVRKPATSSQDDDAAFMESLGLVEGKEPVQQAIHNDGRLESTKQPPVQTAMPNNSQTYTLNSVPKYSFLSIFFTIVGVFFILASGYPQLQSYPTYDQRNNFGYGFKTDNAYGATAEASLDTAHAVKFLAQHQPSDALMKSSLWVIAFLLCNTIVILERIRLAIVHKRQ